MLWGLFLLIAAVWAVFLIPPLWADRRSFLLEAGRRAALTRGPASSSTDTYRNPPSERRAGTEPTTDNQILMRRRRMLIALGVAAIGSLAAFVALGGITFLTLHVAADLSLLWYVVSLRRIAVRRHTAVLAQAVDEQAKEDLYSSRVRVVQSR